MLNGLSLFSGIGGLDVALSDYVRPIAYCEIDPYCQAVLFSRMADESLPNSPIWDDITTLSGLPFNGSIDIVYGGFPCQDISIAGLGKGLEGERSGLITQVFRLLREARPGFLFLENVPAISTRGAIRIIREIAEIGYDCRFCVLSASCIGAPHKRERWFLLAHSNSKPSGQTNQVSQSIKIGKETRLRSARQNRTEKPRTYWKENKCPPIGMDYGLPYELDRAKALGNSVVPQQARKAFEILMGIQ